MVKMHLSKSKYIASILFVLSFVSSTTLAASRRKSAPVCNNALIPELDRHCADCAWKIVTRLQKTPLLGNSADNSEFDRRVQSRIALVRRLQGLGFREVRDQLIEELGRTFVDNGSLFKDFEDELGHTFPGNSTLFDTLGYRHALLEVLEPMLRREDRFVLDMFVEATSDLNRRLKRFYLEQGRMGNIIGELNALNTELVRIRRRFDQRSNGSLESGMPLPSCYPENAAIQAWLLVTQLQKMRASVMRFTERRPGYYYNLEKMKDVVRALMGAEFLEVKQLLLEELRLTLEGRSLGPIDNLSYGTVLFQVLRPMLRADDASVLESLIDKARQLITRLIQRGVQVDFEKHALAEVKAISTQLTNVWESYQGPHNFGRRLPRNNPPLPTYLADVREYQARGFIENSRVDNGAHPARISAQDGRKIVQILRRMGSRDRDLHTEYIGTELAPSLLSWVGFREIKELVFRAIEAELSLAPGQPNTYHAEVSRQGIFGMFGARLPLLERLLGGLLDVVDADDVPRLELIQNVIWRRFRSEIRGDYSRAELPPQNWDLVLRVARQQSARINLPSIQWGGPDERGGFSFPFDQFQFADKAPNLTERELTIRTRRNPILEALGDVPIDVVDLRHGEYIRRTIGPTLPDAGTIRRAYYSETEVRPQPDRPLIHRWPLSSRRW